MAAGGAGALSSPPQSQRHSFETILARRARRLPCLEARERLPYIEVMESEQSRTLHEVADDELLKRLQELVAHSHRLEADLVAHIGEVDERRLYARQAFPSMHAYCTEHLHLSEAEAYRRITVARAARKHSVLLRMLRDGRLHLTGMALLVPVLNRQPRGDPRASDASHQAPDRGARRRAFAAAGRALRDEKASAAHGRTDAVHRARRRRRARCRRTRLREELRPRAPSSRPACLLAPSQRVEPLSPGRYKIQLTASAAFCDKLERLKALMRSEVPSGDLAEILERAVTEKLSRLEARRFARTAAPRKSLADTSTTPATRHIPAAVRRAVHERDASRCRFVDLQGRRCSERRQLEFHHRHPFGIGGDHSTENIALLCSTHNRCLAEHDYGEAAHVRRRPAGRAD